MWRHRWFLLAAIIRWRPTVRKLLHLFRNYKSQRETEKTRGRVMLDTSRKADEVRSISHHKNPHCHPPWWWSVFCVALPWPRRGAPLTWQGKTTLWSLLAFSTLDWFLLLPCQSSPPTSLWSADLCRSASGWPGKSFWWNERRGGGLWVV